MLTAEKPKPTQEPATKKTLTGAGKTSSSNLPNAPIGKSTGNLLEIITIFCANELHFFVHFLK